jgi:serine/threonine protein kinase
VALSIPPHDNIVPTTGLEYLAGSYYLVSHYVSNDQFPQNSLRDLMSNKFLSGFFAWVTAVGVVQGLLHARQYGVLAHLDLKPENIMVESAIEVPELPIARLTDWETGVCIEDVDEVQYTGSNPFPAHFCGADSSGCVVPRLTTHGYSAPELALAPVKASECELADTYSLGCCLQEILTDAPVYLTGVLSLRQMRKAIASKGTFGLDEAKMARLVRAMLETRPHRRPRLDDLVGELSDIGSTKSKFELDFRATAQVESPNESGIRALGLHKVGRDDLAWDAFDPSSEDVTFFDDDDFGMTMSIRPSQEEALITRIASPGPASSAKDIEHAVTTRLLVGQFQAARDLLDHLTADAETAAVIVDAAELIRLRNKIDESEAQLCHTRGLQLDRLHRDEEAIPLLKSACHLAPDQGGFWYDLGVLLQRTGSFVEAASTFERVLELGSRSVPRAFVLNNLGVCKMAAHDFAAAVTALQEAIRTDPRYSRPFTNIASVYALIGQREEAVHMYEEALKRDPANRVAMMALLGLRSEMEAEA